MRKLMCILLTLAMLISGIAALAEENGIFVRSGTDRFITQKPAGTFTEYSSGRDARGLLIYPEAPGGGWPYVAVHRRSAEERIEDPEAYLNNIFRETLEDSYKTARVTMNPAEPMEAGGKQMIGARYFIKGKSYEGTLICLIETRDSGDVEYAAAFEAADEEITMKTLDLAAAHYLEEERQAEAGILAEDGDDADWEAWNQWYADRFAAEFTANLTDKQLLTLRIEGRDYVLGQTTLRDFTDNGWIVLSKDADGVFVLDNGEDAGELLAETEHGAENEPVLTLDASGINPDAEEIGYCGFDGQIDVGTRNDPDHFWYREFAANSLMMLIDGELPEGFMRWGGLRDWLVTDFGAGQNGKGTYETAIPLSDGRTLYVSTRDSQVRISLIGF